MRASLFAAASALCAFGAIACFAIATLLVFLKSGYASTLYLCTFFMGPSARLFDWLALRYICESDEAKMLECVSCDEEPAMVAAQRRFNAFMQRKRHRAAEKQVRKAGDKHQVLEV
jgi:hypothetical protein